MNSNDGNGLKRRDFLKLLGGRDRSRWWRPGARADRTDVPARRRQLTHDDATIDR